MAVCLFAHIVCVCVGLYTHSNRGPITIEDNRVHDCQWIHGWKACTKPMVQTHQHTATHYYTAILESNWPIANLAGRVDSDVCTGSRGSQVQIPPTKYHQRSRKLKADVWNGEKFSIYIHTPDASSIFWHFSS